MSDKPKICDYCKKEMKRWVDLYDWNTHKYHRVHFKCYKKSYSDYWMNKELENTGGSSDKKHQSYNK